MSPQTYQASCNLKDGFETIVQCTTNSEESTTCATLSYNTPHPVGSIFVSSSSSLLQVFYDKKKVSWDLRKNEATGSLGTALRLNKTSVQIQFGDDTYIMDKGKDEFQFHLRKLPLVDVRGVGKTEARGEVVGKFGFQKGEWDYRMECDEMVSIRLMLFCLWIINLVRLHSSGHAKLHRLPLKNRLKGLKVTHGWIAAEVTLLGLAALI